MASIRQWACAGYGSVKSLGIIGRHKQLRTLQTHRGNPFGNACAWEGYKEVKKVNHAVMQVAGKTGWLRLFYAKDSHACTASQAMKPLHSRNGHWLQARGQWGHNFYFILFLPI